MYINVYLFIFNPRPMALLVLIKRLIICMLSFSHFLFGDHMFAAPMPDLVALRG